VLFIEQNRPLGPQITGTQEPFRWIFMSDVCKHCENAGCLEACPTGSIFRTEFGSVYVQPDVCNGCGYCVVSCPFGVIDRRPGEGLAFKCTFCYDRQLDGLTPACAKACPTRSIQFGELSELQERARQRVEELRQHGYQDPRLYDAKETSVGGAHAFFLILGEPEAYNLPPAPDVPTVHLKAAWTAALLSAAALFAVVCVAFML
jgi:formate dehydrogenase iron-sulfur subunit